MWANGLPTRPGVLSDEEQAFLQTSAAERLALGNDIVQYKKMMQLIDWASQRRQAAVELGKFTKDSCGYDERLDVVSVKYPFAAWAEAAEGQAVFAAGQLGPPLEPGEGDPALRGMCEKKRCKPHNGWYKILMGAVRGDDGGGGGKARGRSHPAPGVRGSLRETPAGEQLGPNRRVTFSDRPA